jgi:hypothetical protein
MGDGRCQVPILEAQDEGIDDGKADEERKEEEHRCERQPREAGFLDP